MDYDAYSANDAIGKVYIDLNPLLLPQDLLSSNQGDTSSIPGKLQIFKLNVNANSI